MWFKKREGQALVETIIIWPILLLLIVGIVQFAQISIAQQRMLMAARQGVWLLSRGQTDEDSIRNEVVNLLAGGSPALTGNIEVEVSSGWGIVNDRVTIRYMMDVIPLLKPVLGERLELAEHCEVAGGTWYWAIPVW